MIFVSMLIGESGQPSHVTGFSLSLIGRESCARNLDQGPK